MAEKIPVPLTIDWAKGAEDTIKDGYRRELGREADRDGFWAWFIEALRGRTGEQIRQALHDSPEGVAYRDKPAPPPPPPPQAAPVVRPDGRIFRAGGSPWRWKGVSAFQLLDRFTRGEPIQPFLDAYAGWNLLRVWPYTDWPDRGWNVYPTAAEIKAFLAAVGAQGWTVELTLLTTDDPGRLAWARELIPQLAADPRPSNLLLEIGNEPTTHKTITTLACKAACDAAGFLYTSGDYEDSRRMFGGYGVAHTGRTPDFPRRAHDLLEYYGGGGPHSSSDPPHPCPWVADEPGKHQDVGTNEDDWRAYFGACALMGAGATFHSETGKYAQLPTDTERRLAQVALSALNTFPADAPLGAYRRIVEKDQPRDARTYVVGPYMVRCQQRGAVAPESGWLPLDAHGILWRR